MNATLLDWHENARVSSPRWGRAIDLPWGLMADFCDVLEGLDRECIRGSPRVSRSVVILVQQTDADYGA